MLLIQGLGYASWGWRFQLPELAKRRRAIAFDNRGTGRSMKPPAPYSIELLADDAGALLDALGILQAHVVGMSMGGYIAQTLALRRPELVRSLVLAGTSAGGSTHEDVPRSTLDVWLAHAGKPPEEYARATMWLSYSDEWWQQHPELIEELLAARLAHPTPPECWRAQYDACARFAEQGIPAEQIRVPTLVLHGDADRVVPVSNSHTIASRIPGAELVLFPGRGHVIPIEDPVRFNSELVAFLERTERA